MVDSSSEQSDAMTRATAQLIIKEFRAAHPQAASEVGRFVDSIIHGGGDDLPDAGQVAGRSGASVSLETAQAAVEFVMAAMLLASR